MTVKVPICKRPSLPIPHPPSKPCINFPKASRFCEMCIALKEITYKILYAEFSEIYMF